MFLSHSPFLQFFSDPFLPLPTQLCLGSSFLRNISRLKCAVHISLYVYFSTDTTELPRIVLLKKTFSLPRKLTMQIANCDWTGISCPISSVT